MKRAPRKCRTSTKKTTTKLSTSDQLREHIAYLAVEHNHAWLREITSEAPHWTGALALHLRLAELEHLEEGVQELL